MKINQYRLKRDEQKWDVLGEALSEICVRLILSDPMQNQALMQKAGDSLVGLLYRNGEWRQERWQILEIIDQGEVPNEDTSEGEINRAPCCGGEVVSFHGVEFCPCGFRAKQSKTEIPFECCLCRTDLRENNELYVIPCTHAPTSIGYIAPSRIARAMVIPVHDTSGDIMFHGFSSHKEEVEVIRSIRIHRYRTTNGLPVCKKCYESAKALKDGERRFFVLGHTTRSQKTAFIDFRKPYQQNEGGSILMLYRATEMQGMHSGPGHGRVRYGLPHVVQLIELPAHIGMNQDLREIANKMNEVEYTNFTATGKIPQAILGRPNQRQRMAFSPFEAATRHRASINYLMQNMGIGMDEEKEKFGFVHDGDTSLMVDKFNNPVLYSQILLNETALHIKLPKKPELDAVPSGSNKFHAYPFIGIEIEGHNIGRELRDWALRELSWNTVGDGSVRGNSPCEVLTNAMEGAEAEEKIRKFYKKADGRNIQHQSAGAHINIDNDSLIGAVAFMTEEFNESKSRSTPMAILKRYMGGCLGLVRACVASQRRTNHFCSGGFAYRAKDASAAKQKAKLSINDVGYPTIALRKNVFEFRIWPSTSNVEVLLARMEMSQKIIAYMNGIFYEYIRTIVDPMSDKQRSNKRGEINGRVNAFVECCKAVSDTMANTQKDVMDNFDKVVTTLGISQTSTAMLKKMIIKYNIFRDQPVVGGVQKGGQGRQVPSPFELEQAVARRRMRDIRNNTVITEEEARSLRNQIRTAEEWTAASRSAANTYENRTISAMQFNQERCQVVVDLERYRQQANQYASTQITTALANTRESWERDAWLQMSSVVGAQSSNRAEIIFPTPSGTGGDRLSANSFRSNLDGRVIEFYPAEFITTVGRIAAYVQGTDVPF